MTFTHIIALERLPERPWRTDDTGRLAGAEQLGIPVSGSEGPLGELAETLRVAGGFDRVHLLSLSR